MPVLKKATRSIDRTVSTTKTRRTEASEDDFTVLMGHGRAAEESEEDLTVLMDRAPPSRFHVRPTSPPRPGPAKTVRAPAEARPAQRVPVERPPVERVPVAAVKTERPTVAPVAVTLPPAPKLPPAPPPPRETTIVLPPRARTRMLLALAFLVVGGTMGIAVELAVSRSAPAPWLGAAQPNAPATAVPEPASAPQGPGAPLVRMDPAPSVKRPHHRHHQHHAPGAHATAAAEADEAAPDAGGDGPDDIAAAVQTLTKAQEEVTIP